MEADIAPVPAHDPLRKLGTSPYGLLAELGVYDRNGRFAVIDYSKVLNVATPQAAR